MMTIDSHQHFWSINDTDYVWMGDEHAPIKRDFLPSDLRPILDACGIGGSVAVQARQMTKETQWLLDLADRDDWIRGVVGWVPLAENAAEPWLEQFSKHPKLVGVRHVVHDEPDDDFILREDFNNGIRRLLTYGLTYDILIFPKHLPQTITFVDRQPEQTFVVDHLANPRIRKDQFDQDWAKGIRELAKRENVSCKVSGIFSKVEAPTWDIELLLPYFETVIEAFGSTRILYGSDWPVCLLRADYQAWWDTTQQFAGSLSQDERAALFGGNATRVYGL